MKHNSSGLFALIFLLVYSATTLVSLNAIAVSPAEADAAFDALNKKYWDAESRFYRKDEGGSKKQDFWLEAQLWDTVMDQYDRTGSEAVKKQVNDVYDGFMVKYPDWTKNKYNDDIMWWTIACTRAYKITQEKRYLKQAKFGFDFVYDTFHDDALGGGIWWTSDRRTKNSCIVGPATIAAVLLSNLLDDASYLEKAKALHQWQKQTLTDGSGKVFDAIRLGYRRDRNRDSDGNSNTPPSATPGRVASFSLTYNQGTYIGANVLLHLKTGGKAYLEEAKKTADWTKANLCVGDNRILKSENQGDGGAFKGIFVRYMKMLVREGGCREYLPWMQTNANTAWANRRKSDNIMGYDWSVPTGSKIQSQSAASAVTLVITFCDEKAKR